MVDSSLESRRVSSNTMPIAIWPDGTWVGLMDSEEEFQEHATICDDFVIVHVGVDATPEEIEEYVTKYAKHYNEVF